MTRELVHQQLAATMDTVIGEIHAIQRRAREDGDLTRQAWPGYRPAHAEGLDRA